jgi:hypothetical protein
MSKQELERLEQIEKRLNKIDQYTFAGKVLFWATVGLGSVVVTIYELLK